MKKKKAPPNPRGLMRGQWVMNPVTRIKESKKLHNRQKSKLETKRRELE